MPLRNDSWWRLLQRREKTWLTERPGCRFAMTVGGNCFSGVKRHCLLSIPDAASQGQLEEIALAA